jgi:simple sugar transport system ATP-binding protein
VSTGNGGLIQADELGKRFGNVIALRGISFDLRPGEVVCVLGDNGAGKSTLIKILSGVFQPDEGRLVIESKPVRFASPRDALEHGIATVFQDLAMIPLLSVSRNFFLGDEPTKRLGPIRIFDVKRADRVTRRELLEMGIDIRDTGQPVGTLSGGERQSIAIARAVHRGAKVLILDEPTSALGVKQAGVVLRYIVKARDRGVGVIFITHNPHHAYPVGDRFLLLNRGQSLGLYEKAELDRAQLIQMMAGGEELTELQHELTEAVGPEAAAEEVAKLAAADEAAEASLDPPGTVGGDRAGD